MKSRNILRPIVTAIAIAAIAPLGMAVLDLTPSAEAGNGNGNGNGGGKSNGGGNGGGKSNGGGHGKSSGSSASSEANKGQTKKTEKMAAKVTRQTIEEDPSMAPGALGKLNGVLNASLNALQNASPNSPIGMAGTTLREALMAADAANTDLDPNNDVTQEQLAEQVADIFDGMTNKTLTRSQVLAVFDRVAELDPTLSEYDLDATQEEGVAEANAALADDVASQVNGFDLADALSDVFDGDEEDDTQTETQ